MSDVMDDAGVVAELRRKIERLDRDLDEERDRANALESDLADAEERIEELEEEVERLEGADHLGRLADVRKSIKAGRHEDAIYDLEKVLDAMDDGARTWWCR